MKDYEVVNELAARLFADAATLPKEDQRSDWKGKIKTALRGKEELPPNSHKAQVKPAKRALIKLRTKLDALLATLPKPAEDPKPSVEPIAPVEPEAPAEPRPARTEASPLDDSGPAGSLIDQILGDGSSEEEEKNEEDEEDEGEEDEGEEDEGDVTDEAAWKKRRVWGQVWPLTVRARNTLARLLAQACYRLRVFSNPTSKVCQVFKLVLTDEDKFDLDGHFKIQPGDELSRWSLQHLSDEKLFRFASEVNRFSKGHRHAQVITTRQAKDFVGVADLIDLKECNEVEKSFLARIFMEKEASKKEDVIKEAPFTFAENLFRKGKRVDRLAQFEIRLGDRLDELEHEQLNPFAHVVNPKAKARVAEADDAGPTNPFAAVEETQVENPFACVA